MTQADLFADAPPVRARRRSQVPASSVEAYQRTAKDSRMRHVVELLRDVTESGYRVLPATSAELARGTWTRLSQQIGETEWLLYIRRGLADAKAKGLVEHAGKRTCAVAGTTAVTWRIKSR